MWTVFEARKAEKHIDRLPKHVLEKYEFWKNIAQISGPEGLRKFPGFHDHALKGEWQGHRSSYLSDSFRVIYWVDGQAIRVNVVDVTHHDYRRK
jgi:addiction module RelE/StbE family toxin